MIVSSVTVSDVSLKSIKSVISVFGRSIRAHLLWWNFPSGVWTWYERVPAPWSPRPFVQDKGAPTLLPCGAGHSCMDHTFGFGLPSPSGLSDLVQQALMTLLSFLATSATRKDWICTSMVWIDTTVEQGMGHLPFSGGFSPFVRHTLWGYHGLLITCSNWNCRAGFRRILRSIIRHHHLRMSDIRLWKCSGAAVMPNGRWWKQYLPKGVIKVVSNALFLSSGICQNPELASKLENTAPGNTVKKELS